MNLPSLAIPITTINAIVHVNEISACNTRNAFFMFSYFLAKIRLIFKLNQTRIEIELRITHFLYLLIRALLDVEILLGCAASFFS
jgi:hypothetical protein